MLRSTSSSGDHTAVVSTGTPRQLKAKADMGPRRHVRELGQGREAVRQGAREMWVAAEVKDSVGLDKLPSPNNPTLAQSAA